MEERKKMEVRKVTIHQVAVGTRKEVETAMQVKKITRMIMKVTLILITEF